MADKVEYVKIPKAMFDDLEEKASRLAKIEAEMYEHMPALKEFEIKAVITSPPSGPYAHSVLKSVKAIWNLATIYGRKDGV